MPSKVETLAGQLQEKNNRLQSFFTDLDSDGRPKIAADKLDEVRALHTEVAAIHDEWEKERSVDLMQEKSQRIKAALEQGRVPGGFSGRDPEPGDRGGVVRSTIMPHARGHDGYGLQEKSLGESFIETKSFKEALARRKAHGTQIELPDWSIKTLFQRTAGFDPFVPRSPRIVLSAQQQPKVVDLLPTTETTQQAIKWMLETTYTNNTATTAEAAAYPESALQYTEQLNSVQKISTFLPVTEEQFADAPQTRDLVNNRLDLMLRQTLDKQLIAGTGTAPQLAGINVITGTQTQAKGSDAAPSAVFKAMTLIRTVAFADPTGCLFHPTDWQNIKLLQTADGLYIWGHPSADTPDRIWGLPVVQSTYQTLGTADVADFAGYTELVWRSGINFEVSNSHDVYFIYGKLAVRADIRVAFLVYRPAAICKVTGL